MDGVKLFECCIVNIIVDDYSYDQEFWAKLLLQVFKIGDLSTAWGTPGTEQVDKYDRRCVRRYRKMARFLCDRVRLSFDAG